jgi:hypothetical protein
MLDPDPDKMNADPQPWNNASLVYFYAVSDPVLIEDENVAFGLQVD